MDLPPDETVLGVRRAFLIPGAAGILMGIIWRRQFNVAEALTAAAAGACCVLWVAPAIVEWTGVKDGVAGLSYWACGLGGMFIVDFISKSMGNPWEALARWRNGGRDQQ